ncbi:MAG: aminopeptidase [Candidatus Binatia bacterium]|nr:MAG: aminopeptidase [Candidatus Binatia bacterium]
MKRSRFLVLLLLFALPGCSPLYVLRAGYGELKILWRREPIERWMERPDLDPRTRKKLELVLDLRRFAEGIGLRVGGSYRTVSVVRPDEVVYLVAAAERFRLEPLTWWFPVVGRMPYKGFFDADRARRYASELEERGYDTMVRSAVAFSTLGWFDDPLLSTVLELDEVTLANVVLHELFHATLFVPGEAEFNESFANFVGSRAALEYFAGRDGTDAPRTRAARDAWEDALLFSRFLGEFLEELAGAYERGLTAPEREELFRKGKERLLRLPFRTPEYPSFAHERWNNAVLLHRRAYYRDLCLFESLHEKLGGDLRATIEEVRRIGEDGEPPFAAVASRLPDRGASCSRPVEELARAGTAEPRAA